jgi:hypothetical protein
MHSQSSRTTTDKEDPSAAAAAAAKRRIEEEMVKIQISTQQLRIQKMKALVGEQASPIKERKGHVQLSHDLFQKRGTNPEEKKKFDLEALLPDISTENTVQARKQAYASKLEEFSYKGREHLLVPLQDDDSEVEDGTELDPPQRLQPPTSSHVKDYHALAAANAKTSTVNTTTTTTIPTLFAYDPVRDVASSTKTKLTNKNDELTECANTTNGNDSTVFYSLVELRQRRVPHDIDWKNREQYLSDVDFQAAFHMSKQEFAAQPKWKRDKLKQGLYLF